MSLNHIKPLLLATLLLVFSASVMAQQSTHRQTPVPALTSDDVETVRSRSDGSASADGAPVYTPGNTGISLELPSPPTSMDKGTDSSVWFASTGKGIGVFIGYAGDTLAAKARDCSGGFLDDLRDRTGLRNIQLLIGSETTSRKVIYGTFQMDKKSGEMDGVCISRGKKTWMVLAVYPSNNNPAHDAADRVLNSIMILPGDDTSKHK